MDDWLGRENLITAPVETKLTNGRRRQDTMRRTKDGMQLLKMEEETLKTCNAQEDKGCSHSRSGCEKLKKSFLLTED
ncbi:hypothetical protein LAZ67_7002648 [Cordylochernes scorpioides]|uniref:Uncharacterized protein n=1 Tax=Cordylochernes scorpioides TaxID=51811 RepID=A0ABY6KR87_9ARAC|nr:hypothetical protein LAZ67_7002648 [Cordylochernes scorpioides]